MDCKDISSSVMSETGGRNDISLLALFTQWQLRCLEEIKDIMLREEFPEDQEKILFDAINDQVKKLKQKLIHLDAEDLRFIQLSLANYDVKGDLDLKKFLTRSLLFSYDSISNKRKILQDKDSTSSKKSLSDHRLEEWKIDDGIKFSFDSSAKTEFKKYLNVVRDINSLYTIHYTIDSSREVFYGREETSLEEKRLVLQKILHDIGEYTKGTKDTPNLSANVREELEQKGLSLKPFNDLRNFLAHQLFSVIEFNNIEITDLFDKGFLPIKEVIEGKISNIEINFIESIIPRDGSPFFGSLRDDLRDRGIRGLVESMSQKANEGFPEEVRKPFYKIYENARRMKSRGFTPDEMNSTKDEKKQRELYNSISDTVKKYVEQVYEKYKNRDVLDEYEFVYKKLVSSSPTEDANILKDALDHLFGVKKAIDSLRSGTRDGLSDIPDNFLDSAVGKIKVRLGENGKPVFLKDELQQYFDIQRFKEKLPLVEFADPKQRLNELLRDVEKTSKPLKNLKKVLKLDEKTEKIGCPNPDDYEKLVQGLKGISDENRQKLLSYSLELKKEKCIKLLEANPHPLNEICGNIVKDKFILQKTYENFDRMYEPKQKMIDTVKNFYNNELKDQIKELKKLKFPYAIQSCIINLCSTWEKAQTVLGLEKGSSYLKLLRNFFSHGDVLVSNHGGNVLAKQLVEFKNKIAQHDEFKIEHFGSVFDEVLSGFKSGPIAEVLSSYRHSVAKNTKSNSSSPKNTLNHCARGERPKPRKARSIIRCLFSKDDVEKFSIGKVDENNVDAVIIDSEKFLTYLKSNPDEGKNLQLIKFIGDKGIKGDYRHLVDRVIQDQGYERYTQNERLRDLYGDILKQTGSDKNPKLRVRGSLVNAAVRIQLIRGIHGAVVSCEHGKALDCGLSAGGLLWSFASEPVENVIVKNAPKIVRSAARFVGPGTRARFAVELVGAKLASKIARGVASALGSAFDILDIGRSVNYLLKCEKSGESGNQCGEKEIRDEIASIAFSGVSFVAGIFFAVAGMHVAGVAVGFGLVIGKGVYDGISNIVEYNKKYDTTLDENFRIFLHTLSFQPIPLDVQRLTERISVVNIQAKRAWEALNHSPDDVVAYGIGFGMDDERKTFDSGFGKILMNITDADTTSLSRIVPDPIESAEMICLPRPRGEAYEVNSKRKSIPTAKHYCVNAMVIANKSRMQTGKMILYDLHSITYMGSTIVGSSTFDNQFLIFTGGAGITGGSNTVNRFVFFEPDHFFGYVTGGRNATNIIDLSQSTGNKYEVKIGHHSKSFRALQIEINGRRLVDDEEFHASSYMYTGRQNRSDHIMCRYDFRRLASNDNHDVFVNSGGGLGKDERDIVDSCKKVVILPYTKVTGVENDYTFYIETAGYKSKDLYSEIDVEGTGTILFPKYNLLNDSDEIAYFSNNNTLSLIIGLGQGDKYTLDIRNYMNPGSNQTNFIFIDENGSNIIPRIGKSESSVTKITSFELNAEHSLESIDAGEHYYDKILSTSNKEYKVFGVVRGKLLDHNSGLLHSMVFGSSGRDIIKCDQTFTFARGGDGDDIYIVESNNEKREIIIDNNAVDENLDILVLEGVLEDFSIQRCNVHFNYDDTHIQVRNYLKGSSYRHLVIMNSREETFIPYVQSMSCVGSTINRVKLSPFFGGTKSQNLFLLPKSFQGNHVVIDSRLGDVIRKYKDKDDLLLIGDDEITFMIRIEDFYNDRIKWEDVSFLLWNNGNFIPYLSVQEEADEIMEYQDKLKSDYEKIVKEYRIDFSESVTIAHNQDGNLASVRQDEERIGVVILKYITPFRITVSSIDADLVFSDKSSNNIIRVKNWDNSESNRVSVLEFDLGLEPITVRGLERFTLSKTEEIQSIIDNAAEICQERAEKELTEQLCAAVKDGNVGQIKSILIRCANIHAANSVGWTPLHYAAANGNLEVVKYLVQEGADINCKNVEGRTPFSLADLRNYKNIAKFLEEALIRIRSQLGMRLFTAAETGNMKLVEELIDKGARIDVRVNGETPLDVLRRIGNKNFADSVDERLKEKLFSAVEENDLYEVKDLTSQGVSVDAKNNDGDTILHLAVRSSLEIVKYLVEEKCADVNVRGYWLRTPLQLAAESGMLEVAKYLVNKGADVNAQDYSGITLMGFAVFSGKLEVVKWLIGEEVGVNIGDNYLRTPLHYAASIGNIDLAKCLIENDAKIDAKDKFGKTPLDFARDRGHNDLGNYLEKELNKEKNRPAQRNRRHYNWDHNPHHGHLKSKLLAIDQLETAASSGTRPSSWMKGLLDWIKEKGVGLASRMSDEFTVKKLERNKFRGTEAYTIGFQKMKSVILPNKSLHTPKRNMPNLTRGASNWEKVTTRFTAEPEINTTVVHNALVLGDLAVRLVYGTPYKQPIAENLWSPREQAMRSIDEDMIIRAIRQGNEKFGGLIT